jgi:hypothetical protein
MRAISFAFTMLVVGALAEEASAQIPYRGYTPPSGPTLPYQLDYFRPQSGVLDQYNQFVAPKEALARQLGGIVGQQNYDYGAIQKQVRESDQIRESKAAATGTSAGFMNYSHYFGQMRGGAPARAARQNRQLPSAMPNLGLGFGS